MLFARAAVLDGWAGIRYSWMISRYEAWVAKAMRQTKSGAA